MHDTRLGSAVRLLRHRRGLTQAALAARAGVSGPTISRIERGHIDSFAVRTIRAVAQELDIRVDVVPRWRSGDLDRLLNHRHAAFHEVVARWFGKELPAWVLAPEVSFSIYGERGVIDILAWHPGRRALLIIELKTDIVDINDLAGSADRRRRLAPRIAAERGWDPVVVSVWVVVAPGTHESSASRGAPSNAPSGIPGRWARDEPVAARPGHGHLRAVFLARCAWGERWARTCSGPEGYRTSREPETCLIRALPAPDEHLAEAAFRKAQ